MTAPAASSSQPVRLPGTASTTTAPTTAITARTTPKDMVSAKTAVPARSYATATAEPVRVSTTAALAAAAVRRPRADASAGLSISSWCTTCGSPARIADWSGRGPAAQARGQHHDGRDQADQRHQAESHLGNPVPDVVPGKARNRYHLEQAQQASEYRARGDPPAA